MKKSSLILSLALLALGTTGCGDGIFCHKPEGSDETRSFDISAMTGIELMVSGDVTLHQGPTQSVEVTGAPNLLDLLDTDVRDGVWRIKFTECTRGRNELDIDITLPSLKYVGIAGSGDISLDSTFTDLGTVEFHIAGSGDISGRVDADRVETKIAGSGDISLGGTCSSAKHNIAGSGRIRSFDLQSATAEATIAGAGTIELSASDELDATISGSGDILYKGRPAVTTHISGSGNVTHQD